MNPWCSNLILSEIPWRYYLHPCPKYYAEELSRRGPTIWVDPPTRNPARLRVSFPNRNLLLLRPWTLRRTLENSGFDRPEVRLQIKLATACFLPKISSAWSISTAYDFLMHDYSPETSIFWSGDLFDPEKEYSKYKDFDLLLCLTPLTFEAIPSTYEGRKLHFNMCCDLSIFEASSLERRNNPMENTLADRPNDAPVAGYVGTLSDRRIDYALLKQVVDKLPQVTFVLVGKDDATESTRHKLNELRRCENVCIFEHIDYPDVPAVINRFDACLIPYGINGANRGTCPTKFIEYCAIGKPIISTRLPGLLKFPEVVFFGDTSEEFSRQIEHNIHGMDASVMSKQHALVRNSTASSFLNSFEKVM